MSYELEPRDAEKLENSMEMAKNIITRSYLCNLSEMEVADIPKELKNINISEYMRLYHFKKLVTDKNENTIEKLVTVLNSASSSNATVITLIKGSKDSTDYYMGVVSKDTMQQNDDIATQGSSFESGLLGNFAGLELNSLNFDEIEELNKKILNGSYVTSVSGIASLRDEDEMDMQKYVQGIEHLTDALRGKNYSIIIIADPVKMDSIELSKLGYQNLYTQLSSYAQTVLNFNESENLTFTDTLSESVTETIGKSVTVSQNYSENSGWNRTETKGKSVNKNYGGLGSVVGTVIGGAAVATALVVTGGLAAPVIAGAALGAAGVGGAAGGAIGNAVLGSKGTNEAINEGQNFSTVRGSAKAEGSNEATANQKGTAKSEAQGKANGRSIQFTSENKVVKELLKTIDKHLERLEKCAAYGAFNCAAYVLTNDPETNAIVANSYNALIKGENSSLQASYINNWKKGKNNTNKIKQYLSLYSHPQFIDFNNEEVSITPASISNSYEVAVSLGLPKKSINGLPVIEMTPFGRGVFNVNSSFDDSNNQNKTIELGKVFHMGADDTKMVSLDLESLAMHTFITGSTGTGKSNYIYNMIDKLKNDGVKFLVIEPAKGEYKNIFGNQKDVSVYGTNAKMTQLLRLNPFSFPEDIHVLEHIDRLVEIFNACWPMYAAMPAVLKDAIEQAYRKKGWNLSASICPFNTFPTFNDLLTELPEIMNKSAYSADTKNDYIGSLVTRVNSLTNGINGQIFCSTFEISNDKLFDENVIIDISRVGSMETKALIMGILVMKLQEYRMSEAKGGNEPLKHITVLEEAHNLLRKTSFAQGQESSNLQGKSVEMITNAIAEMRTYGEGFIIADQSPCLMDESVIRNTNTKILLRLPDGDDRELVGKSAALNEDQINELAKLPVGVAAIYQNNWLEAVLCHTNKHKSSEKDIFVYKKQDNFDLFNKFFENVFGLTEKLDLKKEDIDNIKNWIDTIDSRTVKNILMSVVNGKKPNINSQREVAYDLFKGKEVAKIIEKFSDEKGAIRFIDELIASYYNISNNEVVQTIRMFILEGIFSQSNTEQLKERYNKVEFMVRCR